MRYSTVSIVALSATISLAGCGIASAPIEDQPRTVVSPVPGNMTVGAQSAAPVGDVLPIHVSVANGSDVPRRIVPSQVFALDENGNRVAPLPTGEAARKAGNAVELRSALTGATVSGVAVGALGAGLGAAAGSAFGAPGTGAILGSAIGGGSGIIRGAQRSQQKADREANQQIGALALRPEEVRRDFTVSGYVFYPNGNYREIEVLLIDGETGDTEVYRAPIR
ncbi:MAG: hypothetical protein ACREQF_05140 [Candidatus Binataceae bacterium]